MTTFQKYNQFEFSDDLKNRGFCGLRALSAVQWRSKYDASIADFQVKHQNPAVSLLKTFFLIILSVQFSQNFFFSNIWHDFSKTIKQIWLTLYLYGLLDGEHKQKWESNKNLHIFEEMSSKYTLYSLIWYSAISSCILF